MPLNDMTIVIGGDAGQGVESTGAGFCKALTRAGLHVFSVQDKASRIRGGHSYYAIKTCDRPITSWTEPVQLIVALTAETVTIHRSKLVAGGAVLYDAEMTLDPAIMQSDDVTWIPVPLNRIARETGASKIMANTAALGAVFALTHLDMKYLDSVIRDDCTRGSQSASDKNIEVARAAHDFVTSSCSDLLPWRLKTIQSPPRMIMNGNEAISLGALAAGCNFTSAYPMTPGTSIFEWLNSHANEYGIVAKQTEDELSAICMAIGAAHVGARSLVTTSGGGFSLMVEALGLAGMIETPVVIVNAQRPGPSTGLATKTEQADLLFMIHASQGEFPRFVFAPGDIGQCFQVTARAFNLAEQYQTPVIILTDSFLANSFRSIETVALDFNSIHIDRGRLLSDKELDALPTAYKRYAYADDGISPRALPGHPKGVFRTTSDEHNELGEIADDPQTRTRMHQKRMKKMEVAKSEMNGPLRYGPEEADVTFLSWGSTLSPLKAAVERLDNRANMLHFVDLWPMPVDKVTPYLKSAKRLIAVEGNYTAQLASLIRATTGYQVADSILRYDGHPFSPEYIIDRFDEVTR